MTAWVTSVLIRNCHRQGLHCVKRGNKCSYGICATWQSMAIIRASCDMAVSALGSPSQCGRAVLIFLSNTVIVCEAYYCRNGGV